MFNHSVKVPRLYKIAAKVYQQVKDGKASLKQLVFEQKHINIKAIYALVAEAIQKEDELTSLLKRSALLSKEPRLDPYLTRILITELLFGKKRLSGEAKPIKTILAYEQVLKAHGTDICTPKQTNTNQVGKPRYVRVNTLSCSVNEAIENFCEEGWSFTKFLDKKNYQGFLEKVLELQENEFMPDIHIPDLLIFPCKTQFYRHPAYKNGSIILQDKASCLPVHLLNPPPGSVVLDMCSAPGMKTTQIASVLNDQGTVYACEMDQKRFQTLEQIVASSKSTCIKCFNKDILQCDDKTFPDVEYILVDPSCSGSGITDRLEVEERQNQMRLSKLAGFQIKILRTALTRYPKVKRVVYSTCSIYPEENEDVVRQVLETNNSFKLVPAAQFLNNAWFNFGSEEYGLMGSYCIYAKPEQDLTNGFFVAVFERLEEGEENEFFNRKVYNYKKHEQDRKKRRDYYDGDQQEENSNDNNWNNREQFQDSNNGNTTDFSINNKELTVSEERPESKETKKSKKNRSESSIENEVVSEDSKKKNSQEETEEIPTGKNSKKKKKKKHTEENEEIKDSNNSEEHLDTPKKKKKKKHSEEVHETEIVCEEPKKKKKKSKNKTELEENIDNENEVEKSAKKKKKHQENDITINEDSKKKKKRKNSEVVTELEADSEETLKKKKNKHKDANKENDVTINEDSKKKKERKHNENVTE